MNNKDINIISAAVLREHEIKLAFDEGTIQIVDFKPFLEHALHADIRAFLDAAKFANFRIVYGERVWGD